MAPSPSRPTVKPETAASQKRRLTWLQQATSVGASLSWSTSEPLRRLAALLPLQNPLKPLLVRLRHHAKSADSRSHVEERGPRCGYTNSTKSLSQ